MITINDSNDAERDTTRTPRSHDGQNSHCDRKTRPARVTTRKARRANTHQYGTYFVSHEEVSIQQDGV